MCVWLGDFCVVNAGADMHHVLVAGGTRTGTGTGTGIGTGTGTGTGQEQAHQGARAHARAHARTATCTRAHTHTHARARTHTYTHTGHTHRLIAVGGTGNSLCCCTLAGAIAKCWSQSKQIGGESDSVNVRTHLVLLVGACRSGLVPVHLSKCMCTSTGKGAYALARAKVQAHRRGICRLALAYWLGGRVNLGSKNRALPLKRHFGGGNALARDFFLQLKGSERP